MEVYVVFTKEQGTFEGVKGVHLSKEEAVCECVKWVLRKLGGGDEKIVVSEWGAETVDGRFLAVIEMRRIKKEVPH